MKKSKVLIVASSYNDLIVKGLTKTALKQLFYLLCKCTATPWLNLATSCPQSNKVKGLIVYAPSPTYAPIHTFHGSH